MVINIFEKTIFSRTIHINQVNKEVVTSNMPFKKISVYLVNNKKNIVPNPSFNVMMNLTQVGWFGRNQFKMHPNVQFNDDQIRWNV